VTTNSYNVYMRAWSNGVITRITDLIYQRSIRQKKFDRKWER